MTRPNQAWLILAADVSGQKVELPFYYVGPYKVSGSVTLSKPDVLGSRQPAFQQRQNTQTHSLTSLRVDGFHDVSVLPYLELIQIIEAGSSVCSLVFPARRKIVAPLLLESFEWEEQEYLAGTGEPTVAQMSITLSTY